MLNKLLSMLNFPGISCIAPVVQVYLQVAWINK